MRDFQQRNASGMPRSPSTRRVALGVATLALLAAISAPRAASPERIGQVLSAARAEHQRLAAQAPRPGAITVDQTPARITLANVHLGLAVDPDNGAWDAVWAAGTDVALEGNSFSVEADGSKLTAAPPTGSLRAFRDPLGTGQEVRHEWRTNGVRVERELRLYDGLGWLSVGGRIVNEGTKEVRLGTTDLLALGPNGWWWLGGADDWPGAVYLLGNSRLRATPWAPGGGASGGKERTYGSNGVLHLVNRAPATALTLGYVRADEASPELAARFRLGAGGVGLSAPARFLGRVVRPGGTVELNRLVLAAGADPFQGLESYGEAMGKFGPRPPRTGAISLWCSWYAHRMAMTEEKVLANAAVAGRHLQPLGFEFMQLDHGWQQGDITGDWTPNERFPHGLKWLADELRRRHGLRLGVWIAPVDVAETSQLFKQHPDWALKGDDGKPRVNWRWYWKPNPDCYVLDATQPAAYGYIADSFRRLREAGVDYFKIDFIAAAGGEQFVPRDPGVTRGWGVLHRAMQAVREGAGETAWLRYCQTPPVLSTGLANSAYGGDDTLDAGVPGRFDLLRDNAHSLAAGYWLNDRAYHREVCDMSVRMQGGLEEVRVRATMMALANCSISWSDELCYLPPSRIRLMQQCLPPGNPPMRPLDLFERELPSVWHLRVTNQVETWDVVGLFNFTGVAEPRGVRFAQLGLDPACQYAVFEFWEEKFWGVQREGCDLVLPAESCRVLAIRRITGVPQLVGTDMHLLQGWHEVKQLAWDASAGVLSGRYQRLPGLRAKAYFLVPAGYWPKFDFPLSPAAARLTHVEGSLWVQEIDFTERDFAWWLPFELPKPPERKEPTNG